MAETVYTYVITGSEISGFGEPPVARGRSEAQKVALGIAGARRGAAHITPFRVGDKVRVINPYYTKQKGMRSNLLKQRPRWSVTRFTEFTKETNSTILLKKL